MLVLSRKIGQCIKLGENIIICLVELKREGKNAGKLKVKIIENIGSNQRITERYLSNENISICNDIKLAFTDKKGNQYKIGIQADNKLNISRLDFYVIDKKIEDEYDWMYN